MTDKIMPFKVIQGSQGQPLAPVPEVVEFLEELLQFAKEGHLRNVVIMGHLDDGTIISGWPMDIQQDVFKTLGALEVLKLDYVAAHMEGHS